MSRWPNRLDGKKICFRQKVCLDKRKILLVVDPSSQTHRRAADVDACLYIRAFSRTEDLLVEDA